MREKFSVGKEGSWIVRWGFGIQVFSGGGRWNGEWGICAEMCVCVCGGGGGGGGGHSTSEDTML